MTSLAEDGEAAWDAFRLNRFDALITDYEMPRLTGLDLIRRMRASALNVPVTSLARGVPVGGELDWLDDGTIATALRARRPA